MGCFFACLGISEHRKSKNSSNPITSGVQKHEARQFPGPLKLEKIENPIITVLESKEKVKDDLSCNSTKKVPFGSNAKSEEENFRKDEEKVGEKREETPNESQSLSNSFTPTAVLPYPSNHRYQNCRDSDSEMEDLDLQVKELDDNGINEDDSEGEAAIKEESSESLFSLSIESRKQRPGAATDEKEINSPLWIESRKLVSGAATDEENNSPMPKPAVAGESESKPGNMPDRGGEHADSVLIPIEGPQQWKKIKARAAAPVTHREKENIKQDVNIVSISSKEASLKPLAQIGKLNADRPKPVDEGISVDASLSSWLLGLETTPNSRTSTVSFGNALSDGAKSSGRQEGIIILGALTMEEDEQPSATSSQRRSPSPSRSPSPDEEPIIIGTVGSYWSHTRQNMGTGSSSYFKAVFTRRGSNIEEKRVKRNFTLFERMLDTAEV